MLTAFKAQPLVELKQRDKSKIESVLAYGDRIIVGLNTGSLRIYRVNEPATPPPIDQPAENGAGDGNAKAPSKRPTDLLHEEEKFSKRAIQQLAIIKEANVLLALTDNYVSVYDLQSYVLQEKLEKTRGASSFAVISNVDKDSETGIPTLVSRLVVAVKRKIFLWSWHDMELDPDVHELALPATVKSLTWITGIKLLVGMDPGFSLINIDTSEVTDINKPVVAAESAGQTTARFGAVSSSGMGYMGMSGWVPKPMATKLGNGKVLLAKDVNTLFINEDGEPMEKRQIPWAAAPDTIGFSYPYLLSLQPASKGALEVRSPETLTLLQTIPVPNALMIHVPQPNISLAHAGKGFVVASDRVILRMLATSYESQTEELVQQQKFDEAISLLSMLEETLLKDKAGQIREVQILKAQSLFSQQEWRDALDLFTDAGAPPARVVALYPESISGELSLESRSQDNHEQEDAGNGKLPAAEDALKQTLSSPSPKKSKVDQLKSGQKDSDATSIHSNQTDDDATSVRGKAVKGSQLEGPGLKKAVMCLCSFLAQSRVQIQKYLNFDGTLKESVVSQLASDESEVPFKNLIVLPDGQKSTDVDWQDELFKVAKLVDTTLFRAYMFALPSLAGPLFRLDNFCEADVVEEKLYESGRYNDLIDFCQGKKLHKQALELLEKFGQNKAEEEVMPALRGPGRTVAYLQQLPPELIDLILEYSKWPLEADPDLGMQVFLADTDNAEHLPRERVNAHLNGINPDLSMKYLEHIILELDDQSPTFHQTLIDTYLTRLKSATTDNDIETYKSKVESFLQISKHYNKSKTFRQIPADDPKFYITRALVLSAMGNHKQALSIYVFQLHDFARAETYCNNLYLSNTSTSPTASPATPSALAAPTTTAATPDPDPEAIYTVLLGLYLRPPPGEKTNWPAALDLLSHHGARIPAAAALDLVPDDLAVAQLRDYFRGRMRSEVAVLKELRVVRGLEEVRRVAAEGALVFGEEGGVAGGRKIGRSRRVVVGEEDHCRVCLKRFGNSAVRVWPDGEVVHYGCGGGRRQGGAAGVGGGAGGFEGMKKGTWA